RVFFPWNAGLFPFVDPASIALGETLPEHSAPNDNCDHSLYGMSVARNLGAAGNTNLLLWGDACPQTQSVARDVIRTHRSLHLDPEPSRAGSISPLVPDIRAP